MLALAKTVCSNEANNEVSGALNSRSTVSLTMGNGVAKGVNELIIPNYKQTWANVRKIADAPEVTRRRMYLETMERVLGGTDKIIIDGNAGQGVVPYLPLNELTPRRPAAPTVNQTQQQPGATR